MAKKAKRKKKNRRTLRKRVFFVVSLCILITVLLFGGIVLFFTAQVTGGQAFMLAQFYSFNIAREMNSNYFLERMNIDGLEYFDESDNAAKDWLQNVNINSELSNLLNEHEAKKDHELLQINVDKKGAGLYFNPNYIQSIELFSIRIKLNNRTIYISGNDSGSLSEDVIDEGGFIGNSINHLVSYYSDIDASSPLYDSAGNKIGSVVTILNPEIVFFFFILMTIPIIFAGIICLIIATFLSKILTIPVSKPLKQLDARMKAIAREEYSAGKEQKVELKRPLREIESIADSTNEIISNMRYYNDLLESQKEELEDKNIELEAQNIELEEQNEEIEAQKEEIEAQHEALIESKTKLEAAQTQLLQSEKMASVGQLTAAIAHEINTPLGAINSNVQLFNMLLNTLKDQQELSDDSEEILNQMLESNQVSIMACKRVSEIIRSLKMFSSLDQAEYHEINLEDNIKSVLVLTSNLWKNKVNIHEEYGDIPPVKCYPGLLNQVFMNIIVNSIHAIEEQGNIYIKTEQRDNNVVITIEDDGSGMPEKVKERIFDYGFTTKEDGQGMGVGLAISRNIIEKHNGSIEVFSEEGEGSKFIISIPTAE